MEVGLLWYDGDPRRPLEDKVGRAAHRYRDKFGCWPNTCYVHPEAMPGQAGDELPVLCPAQEPRAVIRVTPAPNVLLHHFWLGEHVDPGSSRRTNRSDASQVYNQHV